MNQPAKWSFYGANRSARAVGGWVVLLAILIGVSDIRANPKSKTYKVPADATNICMMNLLLVIHPFICRLQTGDVGRQTSQKIVGWNHGLRIIFPDDCIDLNAREY